VKLKTPTPTARRRAIISWSINRNS
jgi:hypothetical protein